MFATSQLNLALFVIIITLLNACSEAKITGDTTVNKPQNGPRAGGDAKPDPGAGLPEDLGGGGGSGGGVTPPPPGLGSGDGTADFNTFINPSIVIVSGTTDTFSSSSGQKGKATFNFKVSDTYSTWSVLDVTGTLSVDFKIASFLMGAHSPVAGTTKTTHPVSASIFFKFVTPQRVLYKNQTFTFKFVNSVSKKEIIKSVVIDVIVCKQGVTCDPSLSHDVVEGVAGHPSAIGTL